MSQARPPLPPLPCLSHHHRANISCPLLRSILNDDPKEGAWQPAITIPQILDGIQDLLDTVNLESPAQEAAYVMCRDNPAAYEKRVREEARKNPMP